MTSRVSPPVAARHAPRVIDHVLQAHRRRRAAALQHVAQRIADQQDVDAGLVQHAREGRVVAGQHRDLLAAGVHLH